MSRRSNRRQTSGSALCASTPSAQLDLNAQQLCRVAAQDRRLLVIGEGCRGENMIHRMLLPHERVVAAEHDLAGTDLRHKMTQRLRRENQGIEMELTQILAWLLLQLNSRIARAGRRDKTGVIGARRVGAEIAAAVGRQNFQAGEAVQRAFEDEMLKCDGGGERVADCVRQPAVAPKALGEFRRALRVNEQYRAKLLGFRPRGMKLRVGKIFARHAAADLGTAQAKFLHSIVKLLHREIGKLERERRKGGEAVRLRGTQLCKLLILHLDDGGRSVAVLPVPERIDGK